METKTFVDENGQELIIKHRKSAVFFLAKANIDKPNAYGKAHEKYICITELKRQFKFSEIEFLRFIYYCYSIAYESWKTFKFKEADSLKSDYDGYYDKDFDNNGMLSVQKCIINAEAPYTQLKSDGKLIRLIKFDKPKFESFIYDLSRNEPVRYGTVYLVKDEAKNKTVFVTTDEDKALKFGEKNKFKITKYENQTLYGLGLDL